MKQIICCLLLLIFTSCDFNRIYQNREKDKIAAEKTPQKFYTSLERQSFEKTESIFSKKFFEKTDKSKIKLMIEQSTNDYGKVLHYNLSHWESFVVEGSNPKGEFIFVYDVEREKLKTQEYFTMEKVNGEIKIVGYRINIDPLEAQKIK